MPQKKSSPKKRVRWEKYISKKPHYNQTKFNTLPRLVILFSFLFWIPFVLLTLDAIHLANMAKDGYSGTEYYALALLPIIFLLAIVGVIYIVLLVLYANSKYSNNLQKTISVLVVLGLFAFYSYYFGAISGPNFKTFLYILAAVGIVFLLLLLRNTDSKLQNYIKIGGIAAVIALVSIIIVKQYNIWFDDSINQPSDYKSPDIQYYIYASEALPLIEDCKVKSITKEGSRIILHYYSDAYTDAEGKYIFRNPYVKAEDYERFQAKLDEVQQKCAGKVEPTVIKYNQ